MVDRISAPQSRRTLLAAAGAGVAALVAQALGRPAPVRAEGQTMAVGGEYYDASSLTYINNPINANTVFGVQSTAGGIALSGASDSNYGVIGTSTSSHGVRGESTMENGVHGKSTRLSGVYGEGEYAGVYGFCGSLSGVGVIGSASTGYGVLAESSSGDALVVDGKARFANSGLAAVGVGRSTKTVTTGFDITPQSQIHCTLDSDQNGLSLQRVTKNAAANTFKVTLSANVAAGKYARVAWIVYG